MPISDSWLVDDVRASIKEWAPPRVKESKFVAKIRGIRENHQEDLQHMEDEEMRLQDSLAKLEIQ